VRKALFLLLTAGVTSACTDDDTVSCTSELRSAVTVLVSSPAELAVDSVTATRAREAPCEGGPAGAAGASGDSSTQSSEFYCYEQGGGVYTVRVSSGSLTWTQRTTVAADECHTTEHKTLTFSLDPATAD
jgi:hypothetical protein